MKNVRCALAVLLLLVFGGGTGLATAQAGDMAMPAIETSADQIMPGSCYHCDGNDKAMTTAACSAFGTCAQGIISSDNGFVARSEPVLYSYSAEHISGVQGAPDPFPPKSDILA